MLNTILLYLGAALLVLWGVAHIIQRCPHDRPKQI